jgi:transcriptional accessory protein Tex/SPT6
VIEGKEAAGAKFSDYFDHREKWASIPAHRALAILRASKEEIVRVEIAPDPETGIPAAEAIIAAAIGIRGRGRATLAAQGRVLGLAGEAVADDVSGTDGRDARARA